MMSRLGRPGHQVPQPKAKITVAVWTASVSPVQEESDPS
jgi:hypothetical protein